MKTKDCLEGLKGAPKYIFINNRPIAVLIDIDEYEEKIMKPELVELSFDDVDGKLLARANKAKKSKKQDFINI
ncbi:MAG: hypothetical protein Q8P62_00160 [Candidatus Peregrinibacteria bacterium]|nr:hypothetical protein [Candidatus Peregrinibacteria bacterium]